MDLVVVGSVAVNRRGTRLGKGAGYSDIEIALLQEAGRIGPSTVIVTTVHPLQVIDEPIPETEHDFSVDLIVTPGEVIACEPQRRPTGLYWNNLTATKIAAIPVLAAKAAAKRGCGRLGQDVLKSGRLSLAATADLREGVERRVVSDGPRVQVLLRGHDRRMAEPLFHDLEVGAASEQPRGISMTEIVHTRTETELGSLAGR